ncbi:MAG: sigma-70 family RNA polymerase sigma factor [Cyanobacteria bacterium P01_A01_bin.114]
MPPQDPLDVALSEILGQGNSYAYSAIATIRRHLYSFHLTHLYEPDEILFDAYLRGKEAQRKGEIIRNPHAWLKSTAFNIIRENSRKVRRHSCVVFEENDGKVSAPTVDMLDTLALDHQVTLLYKALREFAKEDCHTAQLLCWRTIEQLSWDEISARLIALGEELPNNATLRQRVSRAKKRIRHILHGLGLPMR